MLEVVATSIARQRFNSLLMSTFAMVALLLAGIGLYGVISYSVTQRTREIGIRMALGATRGSVMKNVVGRGMVLSGVGVGMGIGSALYLNRFLASMLFGVSATDIPTFATISLALSLIALLACSIPARRATHVDPMVALREE
jgi:putative ABC transport system permease protein